MDVRIVAAAIKDACGQVHTLKPPARHDTIFKRMQDRQYNVRGTIQGFLLNDGTFVTRRQAAVVAHKMGQMLTPEPEAPETLFSEDLW